MLHLSVQIFMRCGLVLRGDVGLKRKIEQADLVSGLYKLAFGKTNDAVKLAFIEQEQLDIIESLDLSLLSEVKRNSNGVIEIKLINRLDAIELLEKLLDSTEEKTPAGESFYKALDGAASQIRNDAD